MVSCVTVNFQQKVWFELIYYMGWHGMEGVDEWPQDLFDVGKTADGRKYVYMTRQFATKKQQGDESSVSD